MLGICVRCTIGNGRLLFEKLRKANKAFSFRRPNGNGGWIWNKKDVAPVLYNLPALTKLNYQDTVFVVEGEKDVDSLTCNAGVLLGTKISVN